MDGLEIIKGDILLDKGLIKDFGLIEHLYSTDGFDVLDVQGAWVTPGQATIASLRAL